MFARRVQAPPRKVNSPQKVACSHPHFLASSAAPAAEYKSDFAIKSSLKFRRKL